VGFTNITSAMLEAALEQLLLQFLDPYVEGISQDKLHLGVFRGCLELRELRVKPYALALLGLEGFSVRNGRIQLIKLSVPWSRLYTGKLRMVVEGVHLEVEQIGHCSTPDRSEAELIAEVREAKRKAIDLRMNQLHDLLESQREQMIETLEVGAQRPGYGIKLVRKILNNIHVDLSDLGLCFVNDNRGLALGLELPTLTVVSTDQTFRERADTEEVVVSGLSMYKLLDFHGFGVRMSRAGSSSLIGAEYVLTPISARLLLAYVPSDQILRLRLEVATKEIAELTLQRSQVKHLRSVQTASIEEAARLHALLVPPEEESDICRDPSTSKEEYGRLYERRLLHEWRLAVEEEDRPLSPQEQSRLQLLEDALSVRLLARERYLVRAKVESLNYVAARRQREAERGRALQQQRIAGFLQRVTGLWPVEDSSPSAAQQAEDRAQLMRDVNDPSKVETVDLPQRMKFEFLLGNVSLECIEDRCVDEVSRQLLSMALQEANFGVDLDFATDHRGRDSADWRVECCLSSFRARHAARTVCRFCPHVLAGEGAALACGEIGESGMSAHEGACTRSGSASPYEKDGTKPWLEGAGAARLVLENRLEREQNLLKLRFEFAPVEVHLLPGALEQLLEFLRPPEQEATSEPCFRLSGAGERGFVDMSMQVLETHGDRARQVADEVYNRIPDRLHLDLKIASPIAHVPIGSLGTAVFSLGQLRLVTPHPCAYNSMDLAIDLSKTALRAVSACGEQFNMIEPVPVHLVVRYRESDQNSSLDVHVTVEEIALCLKHEALRMFLATPGAIMSIMNTTQLDAPVQAGSLEPVAASSLSQRASDFVRDVLGADNAAAAAAARRVAEVRAKQFRVNVAMQFSALEVTLADAMKPAVKLRLEMLPPGLTLYQQNIPNVLALNIDNSALEVEILNPYKGAWEPLVERFCLGFRLVRTPAEEEEEEEGEDDLATHVVVSGHEPLLLNLTPTAIRLVCSIVPLFASSLVALQQEVDPASDASTGPSGAGGTKYRVVNLCEYPLELEFKCRHRVGLVTQIEPTGSLWEPLDDWILPYFSSALVVRVPGCQSSEPLLLDRSGVVLIPDSGVVAELLAPNASHRLLLLASPLRVHNQTDLTLSIRFHDAVQREVLLIDTCQTTACDGTLLGHERTRHKVVSEYTDMGPGTASVESVLTLMPNELASVPALALSRASRGSSGGDAHTWLSLRPAAMGADFCEAVRVGARHTQKVLCHNGGSADSVGHEDAETNGPSHVHLLLDSRSHTAHPSTPISLTTIVVRPALVLANALPVFDRLTVGLASRGQLRAGCWREAKVPKLACLHLYSFPAALHEGIIVRACLDDGAPWSSPILFQPEAFNDPDAGQTLHLCQRRGDAAAGITVEPLGLCSLRFSCPAWYVDRSGLSRPLALELHREECPLPHTDGITLLPTDCFEEPCQLLLRSACSRFAVREVRLPPSWSVLAWSTPCGPFAFCMQTDDVDSSDVLGARCQVITLRPRLLLANSSGYDIEVCFAGNRIMRLTAGQALEWHWAAKLGNEDSLGTHLCFRPLREPRFQWSGIAICSDGAAGSTPFSLLVAEDGTSVSDGNSQGGNEVGIRDRFIEVWSVEVAPARGALSVSFRQGSDFVAANHALRAQVRMVIRPCGGCEGVAAFEVEIPLGEEVPYGWAQPFLGAQSRAVDLIVSGLRCHVRDVRQTRRRVIAPLGVVIVVACRGTQTLLTLEDHVPLAAACRGADATRDSPMAASLSGASWLQRVEVKLSHLGVSIVEELPQPRELLYLHLELVRLEWRQIDNDLQQLKLAISEVQVDCQLPGRVDAHTADQRRDDSLGLLERERPAVILANRGDGDRAFLSLFVQRCATSSRDIVLPFTELAMDAMDITVDDGWLQPLTDFLAASAQENVHCCEVRLDYVMSMAGLPIADGYVPPPLPPVVQVDELRISAVQLTAWCALRLQTLRFLPAYVLTAIRVLSLSGQLTLDGATLSLPSRTLPPHRGSLSDFLRGLASDYTINLLNNTATLLGKSSVVNLPRIPLQVGTTAVSYVSDTIGLAAGEAASLLSRLTFDDEYVQQQRQIRGDKQIRSLSEGMVEASKSIAQGVDGLLDVVRKPMEGVESRGLRGLLGGMGRGVACSFVKPITKAGQAIADIGSGIAAQVGPDSVSSKRRRARLRRRLPRLLFSELGTINPWSDLEAAILRQLGRLLTSGVSVVVPLTQWGPERTVLLLFPDRLILAQVSMADQSSESSIAETTRRRSSGLGASSGSDRGNRNGSAPTASPLHQSISELMPATLIEASHETAVKLVMQAFKPINTLYYGVQDIERQLIGAHITQGDTRDPVLCRRLRVLLFKNLRNVFVSEEDMLQLEDLQGCTVDLPLFAAPVGKAARDALAAGLCSACAHVDGVADWDDLHNALRVERRTVERLGSHNTNRFSASGTPSMRDGAGQRTLEVFEVERWVPATGEWKTAFLPTDRDLSWRWVDATGCRHPHLDSGLSRKEVSSQSVPPCNLDTLFHSTSEWAVDKHDGTDPDGWSYSLAWNSSTWDARPGLLDALRRRRWTRSFT